MLSPFSCPALLHSHTSWPCAKGLRDQASGSAFHALPLPAPRGSAGGLEDGPARPVPARNAQHRPRAAGARGQAALPDRERRHRDAQWEADVQLPGDDRRIFPRPQPRADDGGPESRPRPWPQGRAPAQGVRRRPGGGPGDARRRHHQRGGDRQTPRDQPQDLLRVFPSRADPRAGRHGAPRESPAMNLHDLPPRDQERYLDGVTVGIGTREAGRPRNDRDALDPFRGDDEGWLWRRGSDAGFDGRDAREGLAALPRRAAPPPRPRQKLGPVLSAGRAAGPVWAMVAGARVRPDRQSRPGDAETLPDGRLHFWHRPLRYAACGLTVKPLPIYRLAVYRTKRAVSPFAAKPHTVRAEIPLPRLGPPFTARRLGARPHPAYR